MRGKHTKCSILHACKHAYNTPHTNTLHQFSNTQTLHLPHKHQHKRLTILAKEMHTSKHIQHFTPHANTHKMFHLPCQHIQRTTILASKHTEHSTYKYNASFLKHTHMLHLLHKCPIILAKQVHTSYNMSNTSLPTPTHTKRSTSRAHTSRSPLSLQASTQHSTHHAKHIYTTHYPPHTHTHAAPLAVQTDTRPQLLASKHTHNTPHTNTTPHSSNTRIQMLSIRHRNAPHPFKQMHTSNTLLPTPTHT